MLTLNTLMFNSSQGSSWLSLWPIQAQKPVPAEADTAQPPPQKPVLQPSLQQQLTSPAVPSPQQQQQEAQLPHPPPPQPLLPSPFSHSQPAEPQHDPPHHLPRPKYKWMRQCECGASLGSNVGPHRLADSYTKHKRLHCKGANASAPATAAAAPDLAAADSDHGPAAGAAGRFWQLHAPKLPAPPGVPAEPAAGSPSMGGSVGFPSPGPLHMLAAAAAAAEASSPPAAAEQPGILRTARSAVAMSSLELGIHSSGGGLAAEQPDPEPAAPAGQLRREGGRWVLCCQECGNRVTSGHSEKDLLHHFRRCRLLCPSLHGRQAKHRNETSERQRMHANYVLGIYLNILQSCVHAFMQAPEEQLPWAGEHPAMRQEQPQCLWRAVSAAQHLAARSRSSHTRGRTCRPEIASCAEQARRASIC